MTPKEKAIELYNKAEDFIYTSNAHLAEDDCEKNCALIAVNEIINEYNNEVIESNDTDRVQFWLDVRDELNAL